MTIKDSEMFNYAVSRGYLTLDQLEDPCFTADILSLLGRNIFWFLVEFYKLSKKLDSSEDIQQNLWESFYYAARVAYYG